jgi:plastocyanin
MQMEVARDSNICGQVVTVATLAIDPTTHGVRDTIVHVSSRIEPVDDGPAHGSTVQNTHCVFSPRVAAVRSGTPAIITNDDPVMHNTNITLDSRTVLNVALVAGGNPIQKVLKREGLHLVTCNVHKFMWAYRYAFNHPFFDQTNETGQFRIMGLSPGQHTVSVWHETLGILNKEIQVPVRGTVTVEFEFK